MTAAEQRQDTLKSLPKHIVKRQAKHYIDNCENFCIHSINKFKIYKWTEFFEVVNTETFFIKCFDYEKDALNYCLDNYEDSKLSNQLELL